jgi:hypothetical protein
MYIVRKLRLFIFYKNKNESHGLDYIDYFFKK